jgi:phage recombination protein Bet
MSTQLATQTKPSALAVMASRFSVEPAKLLSTLKNTVFKNASDDELLALVVVANEYGLNPLTKEIYAFPAKGGGIVPVVSIDGWINRMNSNAQFDGIEFIDSLDDKSKPVSTTAVIWRKDRSRPVKVTEYYAECKRNTEPWNQMPMRMLRHKALCQAVRVAFGFSGVFDEDEARDVAMRDVTPAANQPARPKFLAQSQPVETAAPVQEATPDATPPVEDTTNEDQRTALFNTLAEAMEEDGIKPSQVQVWAFRNKVIESDKLALSGLPVEQLKVLVERWADVRGGIVG